MSRKVPLEQVAAWSMGAAVGGVLAFALARGLSAFLSGLGNLTGHGGHGPDPVGDATVILTVVSAGFGVLIVILLTANQTWKGPRIHVAVLVGLMLGLPAVAVVVAYRADVQARNTACHSAVDEIRNVGFGFEISWDSPLRVQDGCREALDHLLQDQAASWESRLAAGLALLRFSDRARDYEPALDALLAAPHDGRAAAFESLADGRVDYTQYGLDRLTIARWIERALGDSDPEVVLAAWWAAPNWIWERPGTDRICGLLETFAAHEDSAVRARVLHGGYLQVCDFRLQIALVGRGLSDPDATVRAAAVAAAAYAEVRSLAQPEPAETRVVRRLMPFLSDPEAEVRKTALRYLQFHGGELGREMLSTVTRCPSQPDAVRQYASEVLAWPAARRGWSKAVDWRAAGREMPARAGSAGCPRRTPTMGAE